MQVLERKSIVVVNDSRPSLGVVAEALERDGYAVIPCAELGQAHALIQATMPDLVMLDSRDTVATSWRAPAMLKLDAQTSAIPILLCLADTSDHAAATVRATAMGCSVLLAPFEAGDLLARVRDLLGEFSDTRPARGHAR